MIRDEPDAFAPKHRWAMDWYYPVLTGVTSAATPVASGSRTGGTPSSWRARACAASRTVRGSPRPRRASAMIAHLAVGETERARQLFEWAQTLREPDGKYWTGIVYPEEVHFPGEEQSSYTAAAVVLAADALAGASPASALFVDHDAVLPAADRRARRPTRCRTAPSE